MSDQEQKDFERMCDIEDQNKQLRAELDSVTKERDKLKYEQKALRELADNALTDANRIADQRDTAKFDLAEALRLLRAAPRYTYDLFGTYIHVQGAKVEVALYERGMNGMIANDAVEQTKKTDDFLAKHGGFKP